MRKILQEETVLKNCKIFKMLAAQPQPHVSFHTPGHKVSGFDITELSYSDNLSCPSGCIKAAEEDIAKILGGAKSFILTDGSTCGVLSILHAAKAMGVQKIAVCEDSHKSVFNGCALLGITPLVYPQKRAHKIPKGYTMSALKREFADILDEADALFFTSPDYYGNVADLAAARAYCDETGKLLLVDGAHGGHLHFDRTLYAGAYADLWVDGVHKSLPALTQGAVVSARTEALGEELRLALDIFRTTSPSYPIMAS
ncbi:MAG: aminotransferase class I/II-fold pyridoxal phosphate-dependent enzyme, partial [Clostridia bacterium]|nr:aminotransferase class I/II-fold pyridoxal phosphate-dependent enzyme [Clostridia bacterium]